MEHDEDINQILEQFLETCELPDFNPEEELMQFEKFQNVGGDGGGCGSHSDDGGGRGGSYEGDRETGREPRGNDGPATKLPVVPLIEDMEVKNLVSLVEQFERTNDDDASHWDAPSVPFRRGKNFDKLFRATRDGSWSSGAGKTRSKNATAENLTTGNWQQDLATGKCQQDLTTGKCQQDLTTGKCQQNLAIGKCQQHLATGNWQQDLATGKCQKNLATGNWQQDLTGNWQQQDLTGNWQQQDLTGNWQQQDLTGNCQQDLTGNYQQTSTAGNWRQNLSVGNWQQNLTAENWSQDSAAENQPQYSTGGNWTAENVPQNSTEESWPQEVKRAPKRGIESGDFGAVLSQKIDDLLAVAMGRNDPNVYASVVKPPVVYATSSPATNPIAITTTSTPGNSRGQRRRWINVSKTRPASVPALATTAVTPAAAATKKSLPWKIKSVTDYSPTTTSVRWKYFLVPRRQLLHGKPDPRQRAATLPPPPLDAVRSTNRSVTVLGRWQIGAVEHMKTTKRVNMRTIAPSFSARIPIATTAGTVVVAAKKRSWNSIDWNNGGGGGGGWPGDGNGSVAIERPSPPKRQRWQTNILRASSSARAAAGSLSRSVPKAPLKTGAETTTIALSKQTLENSVMLLIPKNALQCAPAKSFPQTLVARVVAVEAAKETQVSTANHRIFRWIGDTETPKLIVDTNNNNQYQHHSRLGHDDASNKGKPCQPTRMENNATNEGRKMHELECKPLTFASGNFRWANASGGGEMAGTSRHRRVSASGTWYPPASSSSVRIPRAAAAPEFVCEEVSEADLRAVSLSENDANLPNLIKVLTFSTPVTGGAISGAGGVGGKKEYLGSYNRISVGRDSTSGGVYFILFSLDDKDARQVSVSFPKERLEMFRAYRQYLRAANKRTYNLKLRGWHFITRNSISSLVHTTRSLFSRWKSARIIYFARLVVPSDKFVGKTRRTGPITAANIRYVWFGQLSQKIMHVWNNRANVDSVSSGNLVTRSIGTQLVAGELGQSESAGEKSIASVPGVVGEPCAVAGESCALASTAVASESCAGEPCALASPEVASEPCALSSPEVAGESCALASPEVASEPCALASPEVASEPCALSSTEVAGEPCALSSPEVASEPFALSSTEVASALSSTGVESKPFALSLTEVASALSSTGVESKPFALSLTDSEPFAPASTEALAVAPNAITNGPSAIALNKIGIESPSPKLATSHRGAESVRDAESIQQPLSSQSSFVRSHCFKNSLIFSFDGTMGTGLRIPTNEDVTRIVISLFNKQGFAVSYPDVSRLTH